MPDQLTQELLKRVPINMTTGKVDRGNKPVSLRFLSPDIVKESPTSEDLLRRMDLGKKFTKESYKGRQYPGNDAAGAMQLGLLHLQDEMPNEVAAIGNKVSPMSWYHRLGAPTAHAITTQGPLGVSVAYNPDSVLTDQSQNEDMLAHELTHVKQYLRNGPINNLLEALLQRGTKYMDRPAEIEAFEASKNRSQSRNDITIPSEKSLAKPFTNYPHDDELR